MNGVEKYVTETKETREYEKHRALGKPIAKERPRMKSTITLASVPVPPRERKWVDVNPGSYDHERNVISEAMIRLLGHDQNIPRETDGAVRYEDIVEEFNKKHWKTSRVLRNGHSMVGFLFRQKEEEARKRFQNSFNSNSFRHISYFRVLQGHFEGICH